MLRPVADADVHISQEEELTTAASDPGSIAVGWPSRLNCRLLPLRASLLQVSRYRNLVGRISLIGIISVGIRVGWRRVM